MASSTVGTEGGGEPDGHVVSIKRTADGSRQRQREIIDEEREYNRAKWISAEHPDGLEKSGFYDFDKQYKHLSERTD